MSENRAFSPAPSVWNPEKFARAFSGAVLAGVFAFSIVVFSLASSVCAGWMDGCVYNAWAATGWVEVHGVCIWNDSRRVCRLPDPGMA
jgi:hypothetical protein